MTDPLLSISLRRLPHGQGLPLPARQSAQAAGADHFAAIGDGAEVEIAPGDRALVPCGFAMALPQGFEGQVRPRSGLAARHGVTVLNAPGTIDADYRGEVKVILVNHGADVFIIRRGDRIAQLVVAPVTGFAFSEVDALEDTARGEGGFGSTGVGA
ncbi:MAG: dUTP diphosphatase [Devosia sp.]|nr:dUTP diphosphatase [Devosia sp.]